MPKTAIASDPFGEIVGLVRFSVVDKGQIRTDSSGVTTTYFYLLAEMASVNDNETALRVGLSGYQRFQPHPNAALFGTELDLYVDEFQATQKTHTVFWEIMVTYTNAIVSNPLDVPAVIGEVQTYTIPGGTLVDYAGNAILNTAGEPPEPFDSPEHVMKIPVLKNVPADIAAWVFGFEDCVNADVVTLPNGSTPFVCAPKTLLISSITLGAIATQAGINYRPCTTELLLRASTWVTVFPSRGFNQLVTQREITHVSTSGPPTFVTSTALKPILIKGEVPTEAQFLDANGKWIPNPLPNQVVLLSALLQRPIPFSQFPLN